MTTPSGNASDKSGGSGTEGGDGKSGAGAAGADSKVTTPPAKGALSQAAGEGGDETGDGKGDSKNDGKGGDAKPLELKLPDGFKVDDAHVTAFKALATEAKLDSATAQKLFDLHATIETARSKAGDKAIADQISKWDAANQADPDIGGAKWKQSLSEMGRAIKHFKLEKAVEVLAAAGLDSNPDIVRMFVSSGRALAEDKQKDGDERSDGKKPPPKSIAERWYARTLAQRGGKSA
jgi:hypothetical protein